MRRRVALLPMLFLILAPTGWMGSSEASPQDPKAGGDLRPTASHPASGTPRESTRALADWRTKLVDPGTEFALMPFWFWNDELDDAEIRRQMAAFREHGVYGFVIHARMGLSEKIPYMGERWLGHVKACVEEAARTGMHVCLYDEGMYPSGSAHGAVVRSNPAFAAQGIMVQSRDVTGPTEIESPRPSEGSHVATVVARRVDGNDGKKRLDLAGAKLLAEPGAKTSVPEGAWRVMTFCRVPSGGHIRGVHWDEEGGRPGAPPAADLLSFEAMRAFLRFAYDPYHETLREHFGKTVFAMFTDEPSMLGRGARRGLQPWTEGLDAYFASRRGYPLLPVLPALFYDVGETTGTVRADFQRTLAERLEETYYRPLSQWCEDRGIVLTGHPAGSDEIRPLRWFGIPGQDMVWRWVVPDDPSALEGANSTVAKCSSSVARHDDRRRNSNELYGAYGWNVTMDEMKWLADWMIVRGVNLLYPHAFYYSVRERRAYERPPDLGMHNAWWPHYRVFADYTRRLCGLMTDGRHVCDVAVLGTDNRLPWRAAKWLFQNQVDFNYLEDWRLCEQAEVREGRIYVGPMSYRLLIVDEDGPLPERAARRIAQLEAAGVPVRRCAAEPSAELIAGPARDVTLDPPSKDVRYTHVVKDGIDFYLLVNEGEAAVDTVLTCRCVGRAEWFDALSGTFRPASVLSTGATTSLRLRLRRRDSVVLCIDTAENPQEPQPPRDTATAAKPAAVVPIAGPWTIVDADGRKLGDRLVDWEKLPGLQEFAGTLRYETTFDLRKDDDRAYELDLGRVGDWAVVHLNGRDLGPRFWAPYVWDVTGPIADGRNRLVVEVTNSWANRYVPDKRRPAGLFGPVRLSVRGR